MYEPLPSKKGFRYRIGTRIQVYKEDYIATFGLHDHAEVSEADLWMTIVGFNRISEDYVVIYVEENQQFWIGNEVEAIFDPRESLQQQKTGELPDI